MGSLSLLEISESLKRFLKPSAYNIFGSPSMAAHQGHGMCLRNRNDCFPWVIAGVSLYANKLMDLWWQELGETLLSHSISGFNNCIFAYGELIMHAAPERLTAKCNWCPHSSRRCLSMGPLLVQLWQRVCLEHVAQYSTLVSCDKNSTDTTDNKPGPRTHTGESGLLV